MDEIWKRAVETALDGRIDVASVRTLNLDGAVKCVQGRLPPPSLFEKFDNLQHLSLANIGVSSLEQFPRLRNLQKLILSDNRIAGCLEFLVEAFLESLRDLEDEEEVDNDERDFDEPLSTGRLTSTEGEIDGHEQGEDDADEDDDGETGEEELAVGKDVDFENEEEAEDEVEVNNNVEEQKNYGNGIEGKMEEFEYELSKIVGLQELKLQLRKWAKGLLLDEKRRAMGINLGPRKAPHMAFLGNPGTGKTTVARVLGKLLHSVGVLSSDNVTEVQRSDLVAEYIGQTGPKTKTKIEEAMGGVLFVDEAYRLAPQQRAGDFIDFGVEALEEIMSVLEDGNLVVIFAGYTEPMKRVFSSNEGFCRRVTHFFEFDDFSCNDLAEMLMIKMNIQDEKSRLFGFKFHPSCMLDAVCRLIEKNSSEKLRQKMNGGLVDHMLNNARENLDSRLDLDSEGDEILTITLHDLEAGLRMLAQRVKIE